MVEKGNLDGALRAYQESLAIGRHVVELEPKNPARKRSLTVSLNKVGDGFAAQGKLADALKFYREALATAGVSPPTIRATRNGSAIFRSAKTK